MKRYTEDHEWLELDGEIATVGVTAHAAEQLGDLVFVELPEAGAKVAKGDEIVVIESVKAAADISAPMDGEITEVNAALADSPETVNADPLGKGWFFKMRLAEPGSFDELMDEDAYKAFAD